MATKLKVVAGKHIDKQGNVYEKDAIVIGNPTLMKRFPGKFMNVGSTAEPVEEIDDPKPFTKTASEDAEDEGWEAPHKRKSKKH